MFFKKKEKQNERRRLPKWLPQWLDKPLRFLFKVSIALAIILFCVICYYWHQAKQYDITQAGEMPARTVIFDKDGNEFSSLNGSRRRLIKSYEIPEHLKVALYAREDQDFETHWGVKISGLVRATIRNVKDGKYTQGGSTLSMQLIKNTYNNRKKTIHRKLLEIALTYRLENHYTKQEILTHYLNRIYFGAGCYGIEEASQTYFGKSTTELHAGESALLAGIIRGPEAFSPFKNLSLALEQQKQVIDRMLAIGSIDDSQAEEIRQLPLNFQVKDQNKKHNSYIQQLVKRHLDEIVSTDEQKQGNYTIHTAIDPRINKLIDYAHTRYPKHNQKNIQTAAVVLDAQSGAIVALNGGNDISTSPWNIALDSKRTLQGAFTPLLYLATVHLGEDPIVNEPVQTGRLIDFDKLIRFAKKLGLNGKLENTEDLYRGYTATSPLKLATAYSVFAKKGHLPHTYVIESVIDKNKDVIYVSPKKSEQLTQPEHTKLVKKMFAKEQQETWFYQTIDRGHLDAWTISISNKYVVVLWAGNKDGSAMKIDSKQLLREMEKLSKKVHIP